MKKNPVVIILVTSLVLGAMFFAILYLASLLSGRKASAPLAGLSVGDRVALVNIEGVLLAPGSIVDELNEYADDSSIKAIVLRIDSPGGGVVVAQEILSAVQNAKDEGKKIVASMGSVAASGGYYIAAGADRIVANPGTLTGSIGVKIELANFEKLLEKIGIKGMVIKAGKYKDIGSPYREMTEAEKRHLQGVIDDTHEQFIEAVAKGRGMTIRDVRKIADGRVFTGRQALRLKLVDEMGDLAASIQVAADLAGIEGKPRVTRKRKRPQIIDYLRKETAAWIKDVIAEGFGRQQAELRYLYR